MADDPYKALAAIVLTRQLPPDVLQRVIAYLEISGAVALANVVRGGLEDDRLPFDAELERLTYGE